MSKAKRDNIRAPRHMKPATSYVEKVQQGSPKAPEPASDNVTQLSPNSNERSYQAYGQGTARAAYNLQFRLKNRSFQAFPYSLLISASGTLEATTQYIALQYGHALVEIEGKNLEALLDYILAHKAGWIQVYDETRFDKPSEEEPRVSKVNVAMAE